jgi:hypothetical protein
MLPGLSWDSQLREADQRSAAGGAATVTHHPPQVSEVGYGSRPKSASTSGGQLTMKPVA